MNKIIGYLLMEYSVIGFIVIVFGWDLELKEKIKMILGFSLFLTMLTIGAGMLTNWN